MYRKHIVEIAAPVCHLTTFILLNCQSTSLFLQSKIAAVVNTMSDLTARPALTKYVESEVSA